MSPRIRRFCVACLATIVAPIVSALLWPAPLSAAAASITASSQYLPFGANTTTINVSCGVSSPCQLYVTKNGEGIGSEVLSATIFGSTSANPPPGGQRPITFGINDGCFNFRVYSGTAHNVADFVAGIDVGHAEAVFNPFAPRGGTAGNSTPFRNPLAPGGTTDQQLAACTGFSSPNAAAVPGGVAGMAINGAPGGGTPGFSTGQPFLDIRPGSIADATSAETLRFDSGFFADTDNAQVYVSQAIGGGPFIAGSFGPTAYQDCNLFPGNLTWGPDVLLSQDVSEKSSNFVPIGGGPYRYTLYSDITHSVQIGPVANLAAPGLCTFTKPYLTQVNGNSIQFNTGFSGQNGMVCVYGRAIPGSDPGNQTPFTFNSFGYSPASIPVPFQTQGAGAVTYTLHANVATLPNGQQPTNVCTTGNVVLSAGQPVTLTITT